MIDPGSAPRRRPDLTYLGFDFGLRKIGIAVGQTLTRTARDLDTAKVRGNTPDWERISRHVATWQPAAFVVGLPLDGRGGETDSSRLARRFGQKLSDRYNLPVHWVNEYLSSDAANRVLAEQSGRDTMARRDQVAARLILESFLEEQRSGDKEESR